MEHCLRFPEGECYYALQGKRVDLEVRAQNDGKGLYRAHLIGAGGQYSLGNLMPQGRGLRLRCLVMQSELIAAGVWPPTGCALRLVHAFGKLQVPSIPQGYRLEREFRRYFHEFPMLRELVEAAGAVLCRETDDGVTLLFPYAKEQPFPLVSLFCFATLRELEGRRYIAYHFTAGGRPSIVHTP